MAMPQLTRRSVNQFLAQTSITDWLLTGRSNSDVRRQYLMRPFLFWHDVVGTCWLP
jgi:hypothetical protein